MGGQRTGGSSGQHHLAKKSLTEKSKSKAGAKAPAPAPSKSKRKTQASSVDGEERPAKRSAVLRRTDEGMTPEQRGLEAHDKEHPRALESLSLGPLSTKTQNAQTPVQAEGQANTAVGKDQAYEGKALADGPNLEDLVSTLHKQHLPAEVQQLINEYIFTPMSILSSAKMEQKIRNVLERVNKPGPRPGIVMLHAKAEIATKMIGIVELAKRQIEKERGLWWQYSKLDGQILERQQSRPPFHGGPPSTDRATTPNTAANESTTDGKKGETSPSNLEADRMDPTSEDEEFAFETMAPPSARAWTNQPSIAEKMKFRMVPVMTIYLSRVPISALKDLYGEQTNSDS